MRLWWWQPTQIQLKRSSRITTYGPGSPVHHRLGETGPNEPIYSASFRQSARQYFAKHAQFKWYASRSEYWLGATVPVRGHRHASRIRERRGVGPGQCARTLPLGTLTLLPSLALHWRRHHDAGLPGPVYCIALASFLGNLVLCVMALIPPHPEKRSPKWEDV